jgi:hypothetical protein
LFPEYHFGGACRSAGALLLTRTESISEGLMAVRLPILASLRSMKNASAAIYWGDPMYRITSLAQEWLALHLSFPAGIGGFAALHVVKEWVSEP